MASEAPVDSNTSAPTTAPPHQLPPRPRKAHILVTGASSGLGRAFFEHFSSFPPTTHIVRGIDARPYPTHPQASSCPVGACGTFNQVDLSAEPLVKKFVAAATQSRSHSRSTSNSVPLASPTIYYRDRHHSQTRWPDSSEPIDYESITAPKPPTPSSLAPPSTPQTPTKETRKDSSQPTPQDGDPAAPAPPPPYTGPFTLIIHSAGIRGLVPTHEAARPHDVAGAETMAAMDAATMRRAFEINTVAAFTLIKALVPTFRMNSSPAADKPKFVVMASRMGSVGSNGTNPGASNVAGGGGYAYRASKAALNAVVRSFSVDVPEVDFALVHPGRVETNLVRTKEEGAIDVGESVADVLKLIDRLGQEEELSSGCFVDRFGTVIPW
ncbi:hypothetical protein SLS58_007616 [Diplodia intermedia]|uniref:Uncharacterized protein n=1 Tax=Diplodia intermedia TaxID=856260 RepID=A0ABR3TKG5_9PEZI